MPIMAPQSTMSRTQFNVDEPVSLGQLLEGIDHRCRIIHQCLPWNQAGEDNRDPDVEHSADDQRCQNAERDVALRPVALFGCRRDRIEANVSKEDDAAAGEHTGPPVGKKRMPVSGVDEMRSGDDEDQNRRDFEQNHDVVGARGLADTPDQHDGQNQHDEKRGKIEAQMPARLVDGIALKVGKAGRQKSRRDPTRAGMQAKPIHEIDNVGGKADAHGHVADGVLQDQVPTDDPGHQFSHGGVGVGVSAAGNGNHRRQLGIAEPGEGANDSHQRDGKRQSRPGARAARQSMVVNQVIEQRRVQDRGCIKFFARDRSSDHGENTRTNDRPDAQRGERPGAKRFLQTVLGEFRVADQLIDRFSCEQLLSQRLGSWRS